MRTLSNSEISKNFFFINLVATNKVKQLLQSLNAKATVGIKSIQHKLVKLVDICFFFNFLTEAIHCQLIEKSPVIIKLIKNWGKKLGQNFTVGAILSKDLSKAFDCIAHDLLIAKLEAQVFTTDTLALVFSFIKERN